MHTIGGILKDPRWLPLEEVKRQHLISNMHVRTVAEWIDKRRKYLKLHHRSEDTGRDDTQRAVSNVAQESALETVDYAEQTPPPLSKRRKRSARKR